MRSITRAAVVCLFYLLVLLLTPKSEPNIVLAQGPTPVSITRIFTGPDGLSHSDVVQVDFSSGPFKLMPLTGGGELHGGGGGAQAGAGGGGAQRGAGGAQGRGPQGWHNAPRFQYVIALKGHTELEIADGKKIEQGPGDIVLVEDTTGKGHITRSTPGEDHLLLWLPIADPSAH